MLHGDQSVGLLVPLLFAATADEGSLEAIHQAGWQLEGSKENDVLRPFSPLSQLFCQVKNPMGVFVMTLWPRMSSKTSRLYYNRAEEEGRISTSW